MGLSKLPFFLERKNKVAMRMKCIYDKLNNIPGSWRVHNSLDVLGLSLVEMW